MNRREFLIKVGQTGLGFFAIIAMGGCGGGGGTNSVSSEPRTVSIALKKEEQDREEMIETRAVSVPDDSTVLDAVKQAFPYEREAPLEDTSAITTIGGLSGHWRYEVNGFEPRDHAKVWPITSDCAINLILFDPS